MNLSLIKIHVHEHTGTIQLNRPEKRNALSRELISQLDQAFGDLHMEKRVRAIILTGAGPAFCAGMDLAEMLSARDADDPQQQWYEDSVQYRNLLERMLLFPKPIIAAVNGPAVAGGAGLVLASDIVIAAHEATFGMPEPKRGIVAGIIAPLLAFRLGGGHAARLLLTAETIDAAEAHRIGLVHQLVKADLLWATGADLCKRIAESAPEALQLTKRILNETIGEQLTVLLNAGAAASATARTTEAAEEGLRAFAEKRPPKWP